MNVNMFLILFVIVFCIAEVNLKYVKRKHKKRKAYIRQQDDIIKEGKLLAPDLITKYGYPCEIHNVITRDGYILEIHRIPSMNQNYTKKLPTVFVHGMISSSADWIVQGPGKSLSLLLSDQDYDVWLVNCRGNRYSRRHITLDPDKDSAEFYNYSYHEIALNDLPAVIDYVLNVTQKNKVIYFGHSQGTTTSYILCSELPEYNDKLAGVFSFGATAFLGHAGFAFHVVANNLEFVQFLFAGSGIHESKISDLQTDVGMAICGDGSMFQNFCVECSKLMFGYSFHQLNATLLPIMMGHTPAGCAMKQAYHYLQSIKSGKFRRYDYGLIGNLQLYGTEEPPDYRLENIRTHIYLMYSKSDIMVNAQDVEYLATKLKNVTKIIVPEFNHIDFIFSVNAPKLLYFKIINIIKKLS